jgi:hypothetical protein
VIAGTDPDRSAIWNQLTDFFIHCADSEIAWIRRLAWIVHAWQPWIIALNSASEGARRCDSAGDPTRQSLLSRGKPPTSQLIHPQLRFPNY